jgi:hypothetical protein
MPAQLPVPRAPQGSRSAPVLAVRPCTTQRLAVQPPARTVRPCLHRHRPQRCWQSDRPALRGFFVACFIDIHHAPRSAHDFGCTPPSANDTTRSMHGLGIHDSARASHGSNILALLASPSGGAAATDTTSTSAIATGEGRTGGTSTQSSPDDHMGEAGLLATTLQTHTVSHLIIAALFGVHLCPCGPSRPVLALCHGRRI